MTEAFIGGDTESALALMHPDVEFEVPSRPDAQVWRGREGLRQAVAEWVSTWEEYSLQANGYEEAADGRVLVLWTERGRGRGSRIPLEHHGGFVLTMSGGAIVHMAIYTDVAQARAAAGL